MKTVRVKDNVYAKLVVVRGRLEVEKGRIVSLNKVIQKLLDNYEANKSA